MQDLASSPCTTTDPQKQGVLIDALLEAISRQPCQTQKSAALNTAAPTAKIPPKQKQKKRSPHTVREAAGGNYSQHYTLQTL